MFKNPYHKYSYYYAYTYVKSEHLKKHIKKRLQKAEIKFHAAAGCRLSAKIR